MYSQLKPAWHLDRLQSLRDGRRVVPVHVQMILSDLCNQDCSFCAYRMSDGLSTELFADGDNRNPKRGIPTKRALELIEECAQLGVKAIQFTGGGEPTVHKNHLAIFQYAQDLNIKTGLVTNGIKLSNAESFMNMTWIRVSVDAGTPETYARTRNVAKSHWDRVWRNIEALNGYQGRMGVGFVVTPGNYREIGLCAQRAKDAGAHYMRVGAVFSERGSRFYGDLEPILEALDQAKNAHKDFIIDLFGRRIGDLEAGKPVDSQCFYQRMTAYIGGDQKLYRCCNTAYTVNGFVGDLRMNTLTELLDKYEPFDARSCRYCQFIGQNYVLRQFVEEPEHAEFV